MGFNSVFKGLNVELQHMVFCTEFLDGWRSLEPLRRSCANGAVRVQCTVNICENSPFFVMTVN